MTLQELVSFLTTTFEDQLQPLEPTSFQIETPQYRLLVLVSEDESWLRALLPIASAESAAPYWEQLLEANFDVTQETRYALYEGALWVIFQHAFASLTIADFEAALQRLIQLQQQGLDPSFGTLVERQIRQIIQVAKQQGQSLEATLQTLDRFYQEGLMGDLDMEAQSREATMVAWRRQLERFWNEVEP